MEVVSREFLSFLSRLVLSVGLKENRFSIFRKTISFRSGGRRVKCTPATHTYTHTHISTATATTHELMEKTTFFLHALWVLRLLESVCVCLHSTIDHWIDREQEGGGRRSSFRENISKVEIVINAGHEVQLFDDAASTWMICHWNLASLSVTGHQVRGTFTHHDPYC